jgi:hypothetical protein
MMDKKGETAADTMSLPALCPAEDHQFHLEGVAGSSRTCGPGLKT